MKTPFSHLRTIQGVAFSVVLALLICWSQVAAAASQAAEQTVSEFYRWYLHSLAAGREPLSDDRVKISKYVSNSLVREIRRRMRSDEGLDEDYFIKAQDYSDDWTRNVVAGKAVVDGDKALVALQLGAGSQTSRKLSVVLTREDGIWKIQGVQLLTASR